jgi:hypothetical protein
LILFAELMSPILTDGAVVISGVVATCQVRGLPVILVKLANGAVSTRLYVPADKLSPENSTVRGTSPNPFPTGAVKLTGGTISDAGVVPGPIILIR